MAFGEPTLILRFHYASGDAVEITCSGPEEKEVPCLKSSHVQYASPPPGLERQFPVNTNATDRIGFWVQALAHRKFSFKNRRNPSPEKAGRQFSEVAESSWGLDNNGFRASWFLDDQDHGTLADPKLGK